MKLCRYVKWGSQRPFLCVTVEPQSDGGRLLSSFSGTCVRAFGKRSRRACARSDTCTSFRSWRFGAPFDFWRPSCCFIIIIRGTQKLGRMLSYCRRPLVAEFGRRIACRHVSNTLPLFAANDDVLFQGVLADLYQTVFDQHSKPTGPWETMDSKLSKYVPSGSGFSYDSSKPIVKNPEMLCTCNADGDPPFTKRRHKLRETYITLHPNASTLT